MKRWFALSAIGSDRPGIVADLAELIYGCDCNLEDSSMTVLGSEFAVLLLLSGGGPDVDDRLRGACKRLEWEKRLTIFFRPLDEEPAPAAMAGETETYEVEATGIDKAGIVARVCRCLAQRDINIAQLHSRSRPGPNSGTPVYTLQVRARVPAVTDIDALRRDLDRIAGDLRIDVTLKRC